MFCVKTLNEATQFSYMLQVTIHVRVFCSFNLSPIKTLNCAKTDYGAVPLILILIITSTLQKMNSVAQN